MRKFWRRYRIEIIDGLLFVGLFGLMIVLLAYVP